MMDNVIIEEIDSNDIPESELSEFIQVTYEIKITII